MDPIDRRDFLQATGLSVAAGAFALANVAAEAAATNTVVRFARFQHGQSETASYGLVEGNQVRHLSGDLFGAWERTDKTTPISAVRILAPTAPSKVLALAGNYRSHLDGRPAPANPEIFFKSPSCLIPNGSEIVIPPGTTDVHYEAELVIVVGKRAKNVPRAEAGKYVLGVTCGNDVSARDWQKNDRQWWRAKASDTFGPCGPYIVSGLNYDDLLLQLRLNGQVKQKQRTSDLIHNVAEIVSWISRHITLEPGDLIYTGTPGTTTAMKPGDVVEVELEGAGVLRNRIAGTA